MIRRTAMAAVALALGLLATGCAGGEEEKEEATPRATAEAGASEVTVEMKEFAYDPDTVNVRGGGKVEAKNVGTVEHTFTVADLKIDVKVAAAQEQDIEIPAKPGTYKLVCTVAGHEQAGMVGELNIS